MKRLGHAFHVLDGGGQEALLVHVANAEHASKAQAVQFLGLRKRSFNGFLTPGINTLSVLGLRKRIRLLQILLPYMACHQPSCRTGTEAFRSPWAGFAGLGIAPVFPITFAVGRSPGEFPLLWANVDVTYRIKGKTILPEINSLMCAFGIRQPAESRGMRSDDRLVRCGSRHLRPYRWADAQVAFQRRL
jgi:hypothetical protein